jgi:hypothetical protein
VNKTQGSTGAVVSKASTIAPFLLGILTWALTVNYLRGGPTQAKGWLKAKFLNQPMTKGVLK